MLSKKEHVLAQTRDVRFLSYERTVSFENEHYKSLSGSVNTYIVANALLSLHLFSREHAQARNRDRRNEWC